jgi:hypothetical protein
MRWLTGIGLIFGTLAMVGCDRDTPTPPVLQPPTPAQQAPARPTTQQLLEGPRKALAIPGLPLTLQTPPGWKVESLADGKVIVITGAAPTEEVQLTVAARPTVTPAQLDRFVKGAQREKAEKPQAIEKLEYRTEGTLKVLERVMASSAPLSAPEAKPTVQWTWTIFAKRGENFDAYEFNFIALPKAQYEQDQEFLRSILNSAEVSRGQ